MALKIARAFVGVWGVLLPLCAPAGTNSVTVQFEASLYTKTCKIDVRPNALIEYGPVQVDTIIKNDAGTTQSLNRDIVLTLTECSGPGTLANSHVVVTGPTVTVNGHALFKASGTAGGVGIQLLADGIAKTDGDEVWLLNSTSTENDTRTLTAALSCGHCTNVNDMAVGDMRATMTFTVLTY